MISADIQAVTTGLDGHPDHIWYVGMCWSRLFEAWPIQERRLETSIANEVEIYTQAAEFAQRS